MGDVFSLLSEQMKELNTDVEIQTTAPSQATMLEISNLSRYDAVLTFGDFAETELRLAKSSAKQLINHRLQPLDLGNRNSSQTTTGSAAFQISAVYTGVVPIVYQAQRALLDSLSESTIWSFLTITPIMMLVSRGFWSGCVAMLPNLMPIFLIFGSMGWMGVAIDIGSLMTASIALGVAVDDTIHFLARYREELDHIPDQREAIVSTYTHCAVPTLQAALISGLGLSVFAFSTFAPTQKFGWLMLSILFAGVISELVLLPALLAGPLGKFFITAKDRQKKARLSELKSGGSVVPVALYSETKHSA
jgi:predicted RND superfamily exporter protein